MAKDGSVAPRERINIKYRPATGDATEEKELPLKLLMLGDYTLRNDETPLEERKPVQVDKDNFNDVMRGMNLQPRRQRQEHAVRQGRRRTGGVS